MTQPTSTAPAWEREPYSIKRHGLSITNCDSEPVHTPGCVQAHGALLVVRLADLRVLQASDNADLKEPLRGIHQYANQRLQDAALGVIKTAASSTA